MTCAAFVYSAFACSTYFFSDPSAIADFKYFAIVICDNVSGQRMLHCWTRSIASTTDGCASIQPSRRPRPRAHFEFEWMPTTLG